MLAGELWVYEDEAQVQEVVVKAVERNVVQEDWVSEEEEVLHLLEVQEVQDHPSHLPPDRAALARLARPLTARPRPLPLQGRRPGPAGHQRR